jgi:hypothetical protein
MTSDKWRVASGEWRVASGEWRVASGEWRVASGELRKKESIKVNRFFRQILLSNRRPGLDYPSQAFLFAIRHSPLAPLCLSLE